MVRTPLTAGERERGAALGRALQVARGRRSAADVALRAGISLDTLRKIERGAIATPAFFTVAALARVLDLNLMALAAATTDVIRADDTVAAHTDLEYDARPDRSSLVVQLGSVVSAHAS